MLFREKPGLLEIEMSHIGSYVVIPIIVL